MSWQCYRAVLRAEAPLHIGWHTLGLIERTRYYIPARSLWALLCAGIARVRFKHEPVPKMYRCAEDFVKLNLRFTCFFPGSGADVHDKDLWRPRYRENGLQYGDRTPAKFETSLVHSQASTSIQPDYAAAELGALHETEYLVPEWTDPDQHRRCRLHFAGYLFATENVPKDLLDSVLQCLLIGAECHRGWGRLAGTCSLHKPLFFEHFELVPETGRIKTSEANCFLPGHLEYARSHESLYGETEPLSGRSWGESGPGQKPAIRARLCWAPGTRFGKAATFKIGEEGVWEGPDV